MAFHCLAESKDLRLLVPPHRTYSLTLQLSVLSGTPYESSPATLLDDVQGFLGQKTLGHSRCISQTTPWAYPAGIYTLKAMNCFVRIIDVFPTKVFAFARGVFGCVSELERAAVGTLENRTIN